MYIEDGDRIAFIGDSITANGGFIGYLFDFLPRAIRTNA